jgi:hypothetical protein
VPKKKKPPMPASHKMMTPAQHRAAMKKMNAKKRGKRG